MTSDEISASLGGIWEGAWLDAVACPMGSAWFLAATIVWAETQLEARKDDAALVEALAERMRKVALKVPHDWRNGGRA